MRLPSVKKLREVFGDNAKKAREILECNDYTELCSMPCNFEMVRRCYHSPKRYALKMNALNSLGDNKGSFHGVEGISNIDDEWLTYLNAGETYAITLVYWRGRYQVTTLGDIVENPRNKF